MVLSTSLQDWSSAIFLSNISKFCPDLVKNGVLLQNIDPCLSTFREFHQRRPIFSRTVWDASHSQSARYYRVAPIIYLGKSVPGMDTQKQYLLVLLPVSLGRAQTKQHSSEWYHLCFQRFTMTSPRKRQKTRHIKNLSNSAKYKFGRTARQTTSVFDLLWRWVSAFF